MRPLVSLCVYLTSQGKDERPVLLPLFLLKGKVQAEALGIPRLPLLPAGVEPATRHHKHTQILFCPLTITGRAALTGV